MTLGYIFSIIIGMFFQKEFEPIVCHCAVQWAFIFQWLHFDINFFCYFSDKLSHIGSDIFVYSSLNRIPNPFFCCYQVTKALPRMNTAHTPISKTNKVNNTKNWHLNEQSFFYTAKLQNWIQKNREIAYCAVYAHY